MSREYVAEKLTDELERQLIQQEVDGGPLQTWRHSATGALETVVGALLLLGMLLLAAKFG